MENGEVPVEVMDCLFSIERNGLKEVIPVYWGDLKWEKFLLSVGEVSKFLSPKTFNLIKNYQLGSIHSAADTWIIILNVKIHTYTLAYSQDKIIGKYPYFMIVDDNPDACFEYFANCIWIKWTKPE
jgi:hypothetical protein